MNAKNINKNSFKILLKTILTNKLIKITKSTQITKTFIGSFCLTVLLLFCNLKYILSVHLTIKHHQFHRQKHWPAPRRWRRLRWRWTRRPRWRAETRWRVREAFLPAEPPANTADTPEETRRHTPPHTPLRTPPHERWGSERVRETHVWQKHTPAGNAFVKRLVPPKN